MKSKTSKYALYWSVVIFALAIALGSARQSPAVTVTIDYSDSDGTGFKDPVLGAARTAAFEYAVNIWAARLQGSVPVTILAFWDPSLPGDAFSATLGVGGALGSFTDFTGAPMSNTWYPVALADQFFGSDLQPGTDDIRIRFNPNVDGPVVLGDISFYYGTDGNAGSDVDFVSIALHELGHGFGFFTLIDHTNGTWAAGTPDIYGRQLRQGSLASGDFTNLSDAQRFAALTSDDLWWKGSNVVTAHGGLAKMFAPNPFQIGSSISHWDTSNTPNLLMEPSYTGPIHIVDLTRQAFQDIGWTVGPVLPRTIQVSGGPFAFGGAIVGGNPSPAISATVANVGELPLSFTGTGLSLIGTDQSSFGFASAPTTSPLAGGCAVQIGVDFAPQSAGSKLALLRITTDDPNQPIIDFGLSGSGTLKGSAADWLRYELVE
jgi:hypothetical protein